MSYMKNKLTIAAIICLIVAGACLIGVLYYAQGMSLSDSGNSSTQTASSASAAQTYASATSSPASPGRYIEVLDGITYEVVTTPATQEQGLSDRANVPNDYAMLFDFPKDGTYGFWMKDMLVPLDMVWVTDSGTIAAIDSDVLPSTYPGVLYPPIPIRYVLETRAGFAQAEGWHVGTVLQLPTV
jgi:uncharacterized membrane protein (UPF0127 family)